MAASTYHPSNSKVGRPRPTVKMDYKRKVNVHLVNGDGFLSLLRLLTIIL